MLDLKSRVGLLSLVVQHKHFIPIFLLILLLFITCKVGQLTEIRRSVASIWASNFRPVPAKLQVKHFEETSSHSSQHTGYWNGATHEKSTWPAQDSASGKLTINPSK